jgi:hypothetical protein
LWRVKGERYSAEYEVAVRSQKIEVDDSNDRPSSQEGIDMERVGRCQLEFEMNSQKI